MGLCFLGGGLYLQHSTAPSRKSHLLLHNLVRLLNPSCLVVGTVMGVITLSAIFSEFGNGANFALVPHCNSYNNVSLSSLALSGAFASGSRVNALLTLLLNDVGSDVRNRGILWESRRNHLWPGVQIPDTARKTLLDRWHHLHHSQCSPASHSCSEVLRYSECLSL